jgi:hypothetical protein
VREAVGPDVRIRIDPHGSWNFTEARRILRAVEGCDLEFAEQPVNSLVAQCFYPPGAHERKHETTAGSYQGEYYFRRMTELRRDQPIPLSCHWWIDYNHAPPGAGYMHLLASLNTAGP